MLWRRSAVLSVQASKGGNWRVYAGKLAQVFRLFGASLLKFWCKSVESPQAGAGNRPSTRYGGASLKGFGRLAPRMSQACTKNVPDRRQEYRRPAPWEPRFGGNGLPCALRRNVAWISGGTGVSVAVFRGKWPPVHSMPKRGSRGRRRKRSEGWGAQTCSRPRLHEREGPTARCPQGKANGRDEERSDEGLRPHPSVAPLDTVPCFGKYGVQATKGAPNGGRPSCRMGKQ